MQGATIEVQLQTIFDHYSEEVQKAAGEAAKEAAELTVRTLKNTSPKRQRRGGKYRRGWKTKKLEDGIVTSYVVYNGALPGLTHLLEYGHVTRNQFGSWGRVRAIKHIAPAAEAGIQRFDLALRARLRDIK